MTKEKNNDIIINIDKYIQQKRRKMKRIIAESLGAVHTHTHTSTLLNNIKIN
ncbi:MAG: hypothetical protein ACLTKT_03960 [Clostridia bacterium]